MALLRDWSIRCIPGDVLNDDQRKILSAIYITASTFGFAGAAVQLRHLWRYRNAVRRSPSAHHNIIFFMALSDLITCLGKCLSPYHVVKDEISQIIARYCRFVMLSWPRSAGERCAHVKKRPTAFTLLNIFKLFGVEV